jgi:hypothetical protein
MYFSYNGFKHANNEVSFTITSQPLRTKAGLYYGDHVRWDCRGQLLNYATQADITAAIERLQNVYSHDGGDVVFYLDDGVTRTAHVLLSANCLGGTRISQPISFGDTYGSAEYSPGSVCRSYTFGIEGQLAFTNENVILEFEEHLEVHGTGGPTQVWLPVAQGPFIEQTTTQSSTYKVTQSGSAKGLYGPPPVAAPIFPDNELLPQRMIRTGSAELYGQFHWPVSWSYTFESTGALNGQPNGYPQ